MYVFHCVYIYRYVDIHMFIYVIYIYIYILKNGLTTEASRD